MGAKTQANVKGSNEKRLALRCDDCERDFLTISALKSHTMAKHPDKYKHTLSTEPETKDEKKTAFVPPTSRVSKRLQQKKSTETDKEMVTTSSTRKTIFQCPKCMKEFGVFFPAHRHIQNRHCEDKDGKPVSPDSPDLIQPIHKEICTECDKLHHGNQPCGDTAIEGSDKGMYCCLACKQIYQSVAAFDEHVEENHDDAINVVILENMKEFLNWKSKIEAKQRVKYLTLSNTTQKQYYQCNYVSPQNSAQITHLCPAVIIVREFSKGIHVRYYKDHFEHICEPYIHQTDDTNSILNHSEVYDTVARSGADVYNKLKDLMKSIAQRASTLKRTKLKPLYISALKMQAYLKDLEAESDSDDEPTMIEKHSISVSVAITNNHDDKQDQIDIEPNAKKIMTDDQIVKALEGTRASNRLKRKSESLPVPELKKKLPKKSESNKDTTDVKENNSQDSSDWERFESPKLKLQSPVNHSPSFNDSYKNFISKSPKVEKERPSAKKVKKEVVKTRIGQFTPSPKTASMKAELDDVASKKKKTTPTKPIIPIKDLKLRDFEYEVVEQENDCNILILKI